MSEEIKNMPLKADKADKVGLLCAISSAGLWGLLPIYWKLLAPIDPLLIMFYRVIMTFITLTIFVVIVYPRQEILASLKCKSKMIGLTVAGALLSTNWGLYIWAVNNGRIIESSIGYYMEPLFVFMLGVLLFRESANKYVVTALVLVSLAIIFKIIQHGAIPVLALGLAFTFAVYGAIKKHIKEKAIISSWIETMFLVPLMLLFIIYKEFNGQGAIAIAEVNQLILIGCMGVTVVPVVLFAKATNLINYTTIGILQYLSPSTALLLGVFVYGEPFRKADFVVFALIWVALIVYTIGSIKEEKKRSHSKETKIIASDY